MASKKGRFWKIAVALLFVLAPIILWLGFGKRGLIHLYRTELERQASVDRIRQLAEDNRNLLEEIHRLRTDMKYVESVARRELNMIKENEIIYRFDKKASGKRKMHSEQPKTGSRHLR